MAEVSVLKEKIRTVLPDIVELRHHLHQIPEIAFKEYKTSAKIREYLSRLGLATEPSTLETDVTAVIKGDKPGPVILLRAEMDGLHIEESSGVEYTSVHPGYAHACGHDGHMAVVLGAATVLSRMRKNIAGTVKFLFQPAEESDAGAKALVEAGYLDAEPKPDAAYALHGWPGLKTGHIQWCNGSTMAATEDFLITLTGHGGHGAVPGMACDLIYAASRFVADLKEFSSQLDNPASPSVVSVCTISGGSAYNVFPEKLILKGTARFLDKKNGDLINRKISQLLDKYVLNCGGKYIVEHPKPDYVSTDNNIPLLRNIKGKADHIIGTGAWSDDGVCSMCGDDFGFILQKVPGIYFRLGIGEEHPSLHDSSFDFPDSALESGIRLLCGLVLEQKNI
ncbi:MAG: amidohydrolase [Spirochaetia bacterium]|nr:amidohydrolase [Spirochaetia bacterium]